ncbi:MAG: ATP-binding protein [Aquabacterium sp.]|nr:ATP-binding protein [Aquabacterium sp.]
MARSNDLPFWLHSRYVLGTSLVVALLLLAAALGFVAYERTELQQTALARSELYGRVLEDQANRTFNGVELALDAMAETARLQPRDGDADRLSPRLQQSIQSLPFLRSINLVDGLGRVVASSSPNNLGARVDRQRLLSPGPPRGLGPLLPGRDLADLGAEAPPGPDARTAAQLLPLVRPVHIDGQGDWLVAIVNPDYFANQYTLLLGDTPLRAALLSYGGQLLVPAEGSRRLAGEWLKGHAVFATALPAGREKGQLKGPGIDGDSVFTTYRTARRQPLVLVVETPEATVLADLKAIAVNVAGGTALLLMLLGALSFLAWRSLRGHEAVSSDLQTARGTLAAHDAFTDRLFQMSPIPMVVKNADGRFMRVNRAWTDFTGITPERAIGHSLGRLYPAQLAGPHEVQEQMAIAGMHTVSYEEQMLDSDGLPRDVMVRVTPYTDADGQVAGVIACLMDVTEFREAAQRTTEAKEAAERASATKGEFLANISHELRTPLQSILGFSELGKARAASDERLQGMFTSIHDAGERMLSLVNNLLDLSRLESTVGEIHLQPQDIVPALRAVVDELQGLTQARGLRLQAPASAVPLWVSADAFRLQQVLRNVLANAIRFAPPGSTIQLDWGTDTAGRVHVSVRDQGPGIPSGELDSIFEAFVQSTRTKDGAGGTGLGLAICRKIMAGHHGRITAQNHPGGGAVFDLWLPALGEAEVAAVQALARARHATV